MADNVILGQYGITQLTGDVLAGPGIGSQAATISGSFNPFDQDLNTDDAVQFASLNLSNLPSNSVPQVESGILSAGSLQAPPNVGNTGSPNVTPVLAGAGAGNLSNGVYRYKFTYNCVATDAVTPTETTGSIASEAVTVSDHTANGKVKIPDIGDTDTPSFQLQNNPQIQGVNIYRTEADGSVYKFVGVYNDADFIDNISDASLGAVLPTVNTALIPGILSGIANLHFAGAEVFIPDQIFVGNSGSLATSKLAAANYIEFYSSGWQSADTGQSQAGAFLSIAPASVFGPGGFLFQSENFSLSLAGALRAVSVQGTLKTTTNATTGLVAGALAAQTNASIVITDASGQVYRIPCII